jgi:hypothetical protein
MVSISKKTTVRKSPSKKTTVRKSPSKKTTVRKSPSKNSPVRKSPSKNSPVRKSTESTEEEKREAIKKSIMMLGGLGITLGVGALSIDGLTNPNSYLVNKITELHNKKYEEQDKKLEARIARHNEIRLNRIARRNEKS